MLLLLLVMTSESKQGSLEGQLGQFHPFLVQACCWLTRPIQGPAGPSTAAAEECLVCGGFCLETVFLPRPLLLKAGVTFYKIAVKL